MFILGLMVSCGGGDDKKSTDDRDISSTPTQPSTPNEPAKPSDPSKPSEPSTPSACKPSDFFGLQLTGRQANERIVAVYDVLGQDKVAEIVTNRGIYQKSQSGAYERQFPLNLGTVQALSSSASQGADGIYRIGSYAGAYKPGRMSVWVAPGRFVSSTGKNLDLFVMRQSDRGIGEMMVYSYDATGKIYVKTWPKQGFALVPEYFPTPNLVPVGAGNLFNSAYWGVLFAYSQEDIVFELKNQGPLSYWSLDRPYQKASHESNVMFMQFYPGGRVYTGESKTFFGIGWRRDAEWVLGHFATPAPPQDDRISIAALSRCHKEWPNNENEMVAVGDTRLAPDLNCPEGGMILMAKNESGQVTGGAPELYLTKTDSPIVRQYPKVQSQWPGYFARILPGRVDSDRYDDLLIVHPNGRKQGDFDGYLCVLLNQGGNAQFEQKCYADAPLSPKGKSNRFFSGDLDGDDRTELIMEVDNASGLPDFKALTFGSCPQ